MLYVLFYYKDLFMYYSMLISQIMPLVHILISEKEIKEFLQCYAYYITKMVQCLVSTIAIPLMEKLYKVIIKCDFINKGGGGIDSEI